ncbi:hypothetical protein [Maricaulis parjimensis]|uniref:hypothetical protein n=1 Tax=Maricaulis parjimensis TaxID=144023 RepID=UPI00193A9D93|nr:hypothetical protein [Maricaulis parjimensis]
MRLPLATLPHAARPLIAWSLVLGVALGLVVPLAGLFVNMLVQYDSLARQSAEAGILEARIQENWDELQSRAGISAATDFDLQAARNPVAARSRFAGQMETLVRALDEAGIQVMSAGPVIEDELGDGWREDRFLLRMQGNSDLILTLLSRPDLAGLDTVRFDLNAHPEPGQVQIDLEFRLVSAEVDDAQDR